MTEEEKYNYKIYHWLGDKLPYGTHKIKGYVKEENKEKFLTFVKQLINDEVFDFEILFSNDYTRFRKSEY